MGYVSNSYSLQCVSCVCVSVYVCVCIIYVLVSHSIISILNMCNNIFYEISLIVAVNS